MKKLITCAALAALLTSPASAINKQMDLFAERITRVGGESVVTGTDVIPTKRLGISNAEGFAMEITTTSLGNGDTVTITPLSWIGDKSLNSGTPPAVASTLGGAVTITGTVAATEYTIAPIIVPNGVAGVYFQISTNSGTAVLVDIIASGQ